MSSLFDSLTAALDGDDHGSATVYARSCTMLDGSGLAVARRGGDKFLFEVAARADALQPTLDGVVTAFPGLTVKQCKRSHANAVALRTLLPWTAPISLRSRRTTLGCGDRLGRATPGQLRAVRRFDVAPVLAQQSIRELNLTGRSYENVVDDATFLVFQEGYKTGFGADGDHLKTFADINMAIDAGMAMITLDLSEVMLAEAQNWGADAVDAAFGKIPADTREHVLATYADKTFPLAGGGSIVIPNVEAKRCAVMYLCAMEFARKAYELLRQRRGAAFDLEISIDETQAPTLPAHHLFIIKELLHRNITISSLAPRFIGEFQKAIDYIGDLQEFERQFAVHCAIARTFGDYKVSIHSGSDKFAVYPAIGRHTRHRVHVKTAGTSWLEAVRTIAEVDPTLYRELHRHALQVFPEALKLYHVTPDLKSIPTLESLADRDLPHLMDQDAARQVLHVTYGGILRDKDVAKRFFHTLDGHEDVYGRCLETLFTKHLTTLGLAACAAPEQ